MSVLSFKESYAHKTTAFYSPGTAFLISFPAILIFLFSSLSLSIAFAQSHEVGVDSYWVFLFAHWLNEDRNHFDVELTSKPKAGVPMLLGKNLLIGNLQGYLSPQRAEEILSDMAKSFSQADPDGAEHYAERVKSFQNDMNDLSQKIENFRKTHVGIKAVACSHAMDYFAEDLLGLEIVDYIETFAGMTPSAERLTELSSVIKKQAINVILIRKIADHDPPDALGSHSGVPVAVVDLLGSGPNDPSVDYYQRALNDNIELLDKLLKVN